MLLNCKSFLTYIISCSAFGFHCSGRWMKSKAVLLKLMLSGYIWAMSCWNVMKCEMLPRGEGFPAGVFTQCPLPPLCWYFLYKLTVIEAGPWRGLETSLKIDWKPDLCHTQIFTREQKQKILTSVDMFQYY